MAPSTTAGAELLRRWTVESPNGASFGWYRATLGRLVAEIAGRALTERGLVPLTRLGSEAVTARIVYELREAGALDGCEEVAGKPGFARAVAGSLESLRLGLVPSGALATPPALRAIANRYEELLVEEHLADRALLFKVAAEEIRTGSRHPWIGLPLLLLDIPVRSAAEAALVFALSDRASEMLATVPSGDEETAERFLRGGFSIEPSTHGADVGATSLARMQGYLFEGSAPPPRDLGDDVIVLSAPGESRECVEIARQLTARARAGTAFDRMAVLLRSPEEYRPHLEEAFGRAGIPVHFARGAVRPDPAGRAFLALLTCALEGLSARRFAEYLSMSELPKAAEGGEPPEEKPRGERWVAPDEELVPEKISTELQDRVEAGSQREAEAGEDSGPVIAGTLRSPRRWEQLLVDSAVIGGLDRWERRLDGLAHEFQLDLEELEEPDGPAAESIRRKLEDLGALRAYALPLLKELAGLPQAGQWGEWLDRLTSLATRALRRPERVLAVLAELAPMSSVGPISLAEVHLVLSGRLLAVAVPPPRSRYGRVFVGSAEEARGLVFDVVCVPGLAEKLFPREIREDPILLDRSRKELGSDLATNQDRVSRERLALRLAVGAASKYLVLSYPRLDLEKGRPRVPSFYGLEALRAAEGRLPGFGELAARAERLVHTRVGWPAPSFADDAIDEAEHDLALLDSILRLDADRSVGTARYLLSVNPHLGRALRFRARRWLRRWTVADGLVDPGANAKEALAAHRLAARSYSATALENYAACPYRFLLQAIHRLQPQSMPEAIEEMDALQRGSLVHDVQFALFGRLREEGLLPVTPANLVTAYEHLETVLSGVAAQYHEELAPAIERVWEVGIDSVRADLREWLRRSSEDDSGFVPWRFELAFGLTTGRRRDPSSRSDPVAVEGGLRLRGSIDLVERDSTARIRITDHKTGKVRFPSDGVIAGGSMLQPVLYALAAEAMFADSKVTEGRLSYCTMAGGFETRVVPLDEQARQGARAVANAVDQALTEGFFPALPRKDQCVFCDYRVVCGPYEEFRTGRKPTNRKAVEVLVDLRGMK